MPWDRVHSNGQAPWQLQDVPMYSSDEKDLFQGDCTTNVTTKLKLYIFIRIEFPNLDFSPN